MYAVFMDESGSPLSFQNYSKYLKRYGKARASGKRAHYPFFVLAAIGFREHHLGIVDEWFSGIRAGFLMSRAPASASRSHT